MNCPFCGEPIEPGQTRCPNCGNDIGPSWTASSATYQPTAPPRGPGAPSGQPAGDWSSGGYPYPGPNPSGGAYAANDPYPGYPPHPAADAYPLPYPSPARSRTAESGGGPGGALADVLLAAVLLGATLLLGTIVAQSYSHQPFGAVTRPSWWQPVLAAVVLAAYWFGGSAVLGGVSPGRRLLAVLAGGHRAGSLVAGLMPGLIAVVLAAGVGGVAMGSLAQPASADIPVGGGTSQPVSVPAPTSTAARQQAQAQAINALLDSSAGSKANLGGALSSVCANSGAAVTTIQGVLDARNNQLAQAEQLAVDALPGGDALRQSLIDALTNSVNADRAFVAYARHVGQYGCGQDSNYSAGQSYSEAAQAAKKSFLNQWNPIASQFGLPVRDSTQI